MSEELERKIIKLVSKVFDFFSKSLQKTSFESFELDTYEIHYLIDCGAGYMGGITDPFQAVSLEAAMDTVKRHDIEKVYRNGELVYTASWSD